MVGIGGDPIAGSSFIDILELFEGDPATEAVVMIGEIGGSAEEDAARFFREKMSKPVFGFIAGRSRASGPAHGPCRRHHRGRLGTHASKVEALREAGITVIENLSEIGLVVAKALGRPAATSSVPRP